MATTLGKRQINNAVNTGPVNRERVNNPSVNKVCSKEVGNSSTGNIPFVANVTVARLILVVRGYCK